MIRYAAHARMYALVMLEVVLGVALVGRALEAPRLGRLTAVTIASAVLLLTHYWSMYLVVTAAVARSGRAVETSPRASRTRRRRVAWALLGGFVLWLPWAPTFVFQAQHTGYAVGCAGQRRRRAPGVRIQRRRAVGRRDAVSVPWSPPASPSDFASGGGGLRRRPAIGLVGVVTAGVAVVGAIVSSSAVSNRYFAVSVPLVLLAAAAGLACMRPAHRRCRAGCDRVDGRVARRGRGAHAPHDGGRGRPCDRRRGPPGRRGRRLSGPAGAGPAPAPPRRPAGPHRSRLPAGIDAGSRQLDRLRGPRAAGGPVGGRTSAAGRLRRTRRSGSS